MGWPYDSLNITWAMVGESPYPSESLPPNSGIWGFDFFFNHMVPAQPGLLVYLINSCNCTGDPGYLLGPVVEALASSLLSINVAYSSATAACLSTSSMKISLKLIIADLVCVGYMTSHYKICSWVYSSVSQKRQI